MPEEQNGIDLNLSLFKKLNLELVMLFIFMGVMLYFISVFSGAKLIHDSPYQYVAGDMFFLLSGADWITDSGDVTKYPSYLSDGANDQFPGLLPLFPMATAFLSDFTGIEKYDILFHLNIFFTVMTLLAVYLLLRKINKNMAILALPIMLLMFKWPFNYNLTWGMQMANMNFFFVITALIVFSLLNLPIMFLFFGILNAGSFFSHMRELLTLGLGISIYFLFSALKRNFDWMRLKKTFYSCIVSGIIVSYYLPILWQLVKANTSGGFILKYCPAMTHLPHFVVLKDMGVFQWFFILGVGIALLTIIFKKNVKQEYLLVSAFGFACIFTSYVCIIGNKTSHIRNFLPFFAAFFIGILLLNLCSILRRFRKILICAAFMTFIILMISNHFPKEIPEYAVSNPATWDSFRWIQANTEEDASILALYGDNFYQYTLFFSMKRRIHEVNTNEYINRIKEGIISPILPAHRRFLGKKLVREGNKLKDITYGSLVNVSMCDYDYIYTNKISRIKPIQDYTSMVINNLIREANFSIVYTNELTVVLKNNNVNGTCFKEKRFNR